MGPRRSHWPSGGFSHTRPSKESLQENLQEDIGDLQEVYRRIPREVLKVLKV